MEVGQIYDRLFNQATVALENNQPEMDPHLTAKSSDPRRGVTLLIRPEASSHPAIAHFISELRAFAPEQYFYQPTEFHVTVLSIIPGSPVWRKRIHHLAAYRKMLAQIISQHPPFTIQFRGVTASPGAVMIQGFPGDETLSALREDIRKTFVAAGLGADLDLRYKVAAAHMTVMRFQQPQSDWANLKNFLAARRDTLFGETRVQALSLIWGDWYASAETARTLQTYPLGVKW